MRRRFADCLLDSETRQLLRRGKPVHLPLKTYRLLGLLVESAPRAVSKEEIRAALWPATYVSDASLTNAVAQARAAIGDSAREPALIRTIHGFGYAFAGSVTAERASGSASEFSRYRLTLGNRRFALFEGDNVLGRDPDATVVIDHGSVSRRHARITVEGEKAILEDLQSRNGTFLKGVPVESPTQIHDGDTFSLGPVILTILAISAPGSTDSGLPG